MTVIIDKWFNIISKEDVEYKIACRNLTIFGKSKKNTLIYNSFPDIKFTAIYDNNEELHGQYDNNIEITKPSFSSNTVIISALTDYLHLVPQLNLLGYNEYYFIWSDEYYKRIEKAKTFIDSTKETFIWKNNMYEHIHVFPDQKFLAPIAYMLENGSDIRKHAFLIYAFNISNYNDVYNTWSLYERLAVEYGNIAIIGNLYSVDCNYDERLKVILSNIKNCQQIIFHGEWLEDEIYKLFLPYKDQLRIKGAFIPWNGLIGKHEYSNKYIHGLLRYCKVIEMNPAGERFEEKKKDCKFDDNIFFETELDYVQPIARKERPHNEKPKILVAHSGVPYTKAKEGIIHLQKFAGKIEVYCILSYGTTEIANDILKTGKDIFGDDFYPITSYMTYEEYATFLASMDAAVWAMTDGAGVTTMYIMAYMRVALYFKKGSITELNAKECGLKSYDYFQVLSMDADDFKVNKYLDHNYNVSKNKFDINEKIKNWNKLFEIK